MRLGFVRHNYQMLVAALIALTCATLLVAQSTTDGAIGGTVFDSTGAVIVNARVTIHNNGTNAEQTATSDDSGYYRVIHLQTGTYTVTVNRQGFGAYKAEQVIVQVGNLTEISAHLKPAAAGENVDVTAEAPQINYVTPDFAPSFNQTAISNLPINGGRWSNFAMLTPGVTSDVNNFGLLSFRGISSLLNNNTVDGGDNNQAFFSEERGRTRIGYSTPKAAVDEFQVNTSNYSSEYGRSAGGVVNTVTKSGTNTIHGEGYFYDRDNDWGAANPFTQIAVQSTPGGPFTLVNFKPKNWRKMAGFGVGGPLIKDKLFLFVAYDWYRQNFPGTAVASNPNAFFAAPSAANISTLATRLGVTTTQATSIYKTDLTSLNTMLGTVPRTGEQNILFPKVDWQIGPKHHASFSANRMRWSSPAGIQTQATNTLGIASYGNDYVKDTWGVAKLVSTIAPSIVNELRYQYGRDFEFEFAQPPTPYELNNLVNTPTFTNPLGLPPSVSITNGFTFGVPTFLQRPAFPDEARHQIADTVNWSHRKHTVKFGVDFGHVIDTSKNLRLQYGSYSYVTTAGISSLVNYFSDLNRPNTCAGHPCYSNFQQAFGPLGFQFNTNDLAFFAQDDWRFTNRLSLSLGFRYEYEMLPSPFSNLVNPLIPQTAGLPSDKNNFGPRVGFAYDLFGDGKTVVRGGYGIYYGRIINSTIFTALTNTGMPGGQNSFFFRPTDAGAPVFPAILAATPALSATARPNATFFDSHFQNPQIQQMDLTVERALGWGTVFSVSYLGSLGRELPNFIDTNICTSASQPGCAASAPTTTTFSVLPGGPLTATTLTQPLFTSRPVDPTRSVVGSNFGAMTEIVSGTNSNYNALVVQVNHRMSHNVQVSANYTWAHAIDFGQNQTTFADTNDFLLPAGIPNAIKLEKGNSIYDIPNRFVVNAVANSPWKTKGWLAWIANDWQFAPIYQVQSGLPYTLSVAGSTPGGAVSGINGSGGFPNRIDVLGVNTFRRPNTWAADMRLAKYLTFQEKYRLELLADFFNIANKQNVTGVNNTGYSIGTTATACGVGVTLPCLAPSSLFGTITNVNNSNFNPTPRQIQLGVRVLF